MWHPFDIMKDHLAVDPAIRDAGVGSRSCRLHYAERVIRWFGEKAGDGQWPPTVDDLPGIELTREVPAGSEGEGRTLTLRHAWRLGLDHALTGTIRYRADGLRSPTSWTMTHDFSPRGGRADLPPIRETGTFESGRITCRSHGTDREQRRTLAAEGLTSTYTLLADFPTSPADDAALGLLADGGLVVPRARLKKASPALRDHPAAARLTGHILHHDGSLPIEFWVNEQGLVIYVCEGATRMLVLQSVEALS